MRHISGDIYGLLMSQGLSAKSVGADKGSKKIEGRSQVGAAPQFTAATGEVRRYSGVRLIWTNPIMTKRASSRACLVMVSE